MRIYSTCILATGLLSCSPVVIKVHAQTAVFPTGVVTDEQLKVQVNGVQTTLTANLSTVATSASVASCAGVVANALATIDKEIIATASCSLGTIVIDTASPGCTLGRACDGTVLASHFQGAPVSFFVDAWHHNSLRVEVEAIEAALGANLANVYSGIPAGSIAPSKITGTAAILGANTFTANQVFTGFSTSGNVTFGGTIGGTHAQNVGTGDSPAFTAVSLTAPSSVIGSGQAGVTGNLVAVIQNDSTHGAEVLEASTSASVVTINQLAGSGPALTLTGGEFLAPTINFNNNEGGSNNAISCPSGCGPALITGLEITIQLAHTLQAGANTFAYSGGSAAAIKSHLNAANNIGTAYAATGIIRLQYTGSVWVDESQ